MTSAPDADSRGQRLRPLLGTHSDDHGHGRAADLHRDGARGEDLAAEYADRGDHHMLVTALSTTETLAWAAHSGDLPAIDPAQG